MIQRMRREGSAVTPLAAGALGRLAVVAPALVVLWARDRRRCSAGGDSAG